MANCWNKTQPFHCHLDKDQLCLPQGFQYQAAMYLDTDECGLLIAGQSLARGFSSDQYLLQLRQGEALRCMNEVPRVLQQQRTCRFPTVIIVDPIIAVSYYFRGTVTVVLGVFLPLLKLDRVFP